MMDDELIELEAEIAEELYVLAEQPVGRRNPPEPIVLVHYGPWHFFFALFPEMMISRGR
jgi:hypothetical protein